MKLKADERAFRGIIDMIVNHKVTPGQRLYEPELEKSLNMSRTPIRQALCKLMSEGIVEKIPHQKGYKIPTLSKEDMLEVFEARANIEGKAAELAATRADRVSVNAFSSLVQDEGDFIKIYGNEKKNVFAEINERIHRAIINMSGNRYIIRDFEQLYWRSTLYTFHFSPYYAYNVTREDYLKKRLDKRHLSSQEHQSIAEAIKAHDAKLARKLTEEHVMNTVEFRINLNINWG